MSTGGNKFASFTLTIKSDSEIEIFKHNILANFIILLLSFTELNRSEQLRGLFARNHFHQHQRFSRADKSFGYRRVRVKHK